jgi:hypothetical protein
MGTGRVNEVDEALSRSTSNPDVRTSVANFVGAVLAHSFVIVVGLHATMASSRTSRKAPSRRHSTGRPPAMPMNCIINAAMDICAMSSIASEEDLVELLGTIRCQFEVVDECAEEDRGQVLEVLEHAVQFQWTTVPSTPGARLT